MINFTKYFSWGDIRGQNKNGTGSYSFSTANYNAGVCGSGHNLSVDIPQGNTGFDSATANIGSPWKMFTQTQGQELINGTNSTWTTINGVNDRKFTSKKDSTKYIFLPAGGYWKDTTLNNVPSHGYYLSTKWYSYAFAGHMDIYSSDATMFDNAYRRNGFSVRAIQ